MYDAARDRMVIYSGSWLTDAWALSLAGGGAWSPLDAGGVVPAGRIDFAAVYDPPQDRMVIFGGNDANHASLDDSRALLFSAAVGVNPPPIPRPAGRAIYGGCPNPARGPFRVEFRLASAGPARLELFDVGGRVVEAHEMARPAPGPRSLTVGSARLWAGVYFMRLTQDGRHASARAVVLR